MPTMKELVNEYNSLVENNDLGPNFKAVKKFPTISKGEHRLKLLKEVIEFKKACPTVKEMTPRGKNKNVQDPSKSMSRTEAIEKSFILYWNGLPCSHGHVSPRYSKSGVCKKCYQMFRSEELSQSDMCKENIKKDKD